MRAHRALCRTIAILLAVVAYWLRDKDLGIAIVVGLVAVGLWAFGVTTPRKRRWTRSRS